MFTPTNRQDEYTMIGPAMKFHMEAQNLKHVDLQCALNFSRASQLTALLKPNSNPKWNTIQRVADALKVSVKSLVVTAQLLKEERLQMGEAILTHDDFILIAELLETLQIKVVAEKFDVSVRGITKLLERRGTSPKEIRANYRDPIIKKALANNESPIDIAEKLGVEYRSFYKLRDAYLKRMELESCTTKQKHLCGRVTIDCKLGLWGVDAPNEKKASKEALHLFEQYKSDGEYVAILGNEVINPITINQTK